MAGKSEERQRIAEVKERVRLFFECGKYATSCPSFPPFRAETPNPPSKLAQFEFPAGTLEYESGIKNQLRVEESERVFINAQSADPHSSL